MKKILSVLLAAAMLLTLPACGKDKTDAPQAGESTIVYARAEPEDLSDVIDLIYKDVKVKGLQDATEEELSDLFHIEPDMVQKYAIRYASGRYGVADVAVIEPVEGKSDAVVEALEERRDDRIGEFENYDIHDSFRIAKEAEIYTRGKYVIMLMLADMETARKTILEQIPG